MKGMTMQNIAVGFHTTGVYPFNRSALSPSKDSKEVTSAEKSGLRFIPLYSPARKPGTCTSNSSSVIFSRRDHSFSDTF